MFETIARTWRWVKRFYLFILPLRFSLLAIVVVALAFIVADQGRDVVRALAEDRARGWWLRIMLMVVATNLLAYAIWFWSRHLLRYRPHALKPDDPCARDSDLLLGAFPRWTKSLPRVLGLLVFVVVIVSFPVGVGVTFDARLPARMWWIMGWLALSAIVYWIFVVIRRRYMEGGETEIYTTVSAWKGLDAVTRRVLGSSLVLEIALFIWACAAPVTWWRLGVAAALVLIIAVWIPLGSYLVAVGQASRMPILTFLLLWAFAISRWQFVDNHEIRTLGKASGRRTLEVAFKEWHDRVKALPQYARDPGAEIPVIIVATEGGGIRAAYWTAAVLASLQDQVPGFAEHCFAISGVSGGSVGAAVFDLLLARRAEAANVFVDGKQSIPRDPANPLHSEAREVLGFDALSGTLAAMAQPDLLQRFLPLGFPDRAKALETGWEYGWRKAFDGGGDLMARPFLETMQKHPALPLLLMNGTLVESGDRIVTSNINLHPNLHFRNTFDSIEQMRRDVRVSTAALLSARFPYVTPAGTMENPRDGAKRLRGRIVDGGYYEVSGAATATAVADYVWRLNEAGVKVRPFVILIDYRDQIDREPSNGRPFCPAPGECGPRWPKRLSFFATEVLSPLWALANARGARGEQAVGDLVQMMGDVNVAEFRLLPRYVPLPLGWVLSQRAQDSIDWSTACEGGNRTATHRVAEQLGVILPEQWRSATAQRAIAAMNGYVPRGVPCIRSGESLIPSCARAGCGEMADGQGESR